MAKRRTTGHIFAPQEFEWRGNILKLGNQKLVEIVPDEEWPNMWRVLLPDGRLTDMVNISRARDAARSLAAALLNQDTDQGGSGAAGVR